MTIEHLAAQDCADKSNAVSDRSKFTWKPQDFHGELVSPASIAFHKFRVEVADAAEKIIDALDARPPMLISDYVRNALEPFRLTAPAPVDPKDARIAELEAELAALKERTGHTCPDEGCPHYGTPHGHDAASVVTPPAVDVDLAEAREIALKFSIPALDKGLTTYRTRQGEADNLPAMKAILAALKSRPKRLLTAEEVKQAMGSRRGNGLKFITQTLNTFLKAPA